MRAPSDPVARLAKLEAARAEVGADEQFNGREMADVIGMSWRNLAEIIAADSAFPLVQRGSEGVPFVFNGAAVLDYMIASARAVQAQRERQRGRATFLAGLGGDAAGPSPAGGEGAGSGSAARHLMEDARALSAFIDVQAKMRGEKEKQKELLRRDAVVDFLWRWISGLQANVLAIGARIDKANKLEPEIRAAVKDELAAALVSMRGELEQQIEAWDVSRR